MPTDLPPLSDSAAVEILDFAHELVFRFEAQYIGQIDRFNDHQRDIRIVAPRPDEDAPF